MTIQFCSDLHLEFEENRRFLQDNPIIPSGDLLVIAGDAIYLGSQEMAAFPFFDWCSDHFAETLIVPGNHEFYGGFDIARTLEDFELPLRPNVRYMNNKSWRKDGVEIFFTTMWPHYSPLDKLNAQMMMNDYEYGVFGGKRFEAFDVNGIHKRCTDWLAGALDASDARTKVVVTHHCPIIEPEKVRYLGKWASTCYMTDMSAFMEAHRPGFWIHGHVHFIRSYGVSVGPTTVHSNPLGYIFEEEAAAFNNEITIDL